MPAAYRAPPLLFTQSGMVRCDWLSGFGAFCRKEGLAFVAVWEKREKTGQYKVVDIEYCGKLNMGLAILTKYSTDFGGNSFFFFFKWCFSCFGTKLLI